MTISRRSFLAAAAATPVFALAGSPAFARTPFFYAESGIAIRGTDAVAYFTEGEPVRGDAAYAVEWMGCSWHFASAANLETFIGNPRAYAPQYGGYCAWAVSQGYTASTIPEAWKIVDDKLYLNFSHRIQRRWEQDIPGNIAAADTNWPSILAA